MSDSRPEEILPAIHPEPDSTTETVESLAAKMPGFSPEAVAEALQMLCLTGVLTKEALPDGQVVYCYLHPEKYRLVNAPDVKQPGPEFGRR